MSVDKAFSMMVSEINVRLNNRINLAMVTGNKNVLIRHLESAEREVRLGPTYAEWFYFHHEFEFIVQKYDWEMLWEVDLNENGHYAPVMKIYRNL